MSVPRRLIVSALIFECAIVDFLDNGDSIYRIMQAKDSTVPRWYCPMASLDFFAVILGWMFEQDRDRNCWQLGDLVRHELTPTMIKFQQGLSYGLEKSAVLGCGHNL